MEYNPRSIEPKWQKYWEENQVYKVDNNSDKPKYYILDMFPYPSGAGLHVGHPLGYIASDIFSRYKRMKGFNVLHPMGFDAFGLPAEEYALSTGIHPATSTNENMERYRQQLNSLAFSFDWSREVSTCDPSYYKWTQWIFTELFAHYYDQTADKAIPITDLIARFEKEGNSTIKAANSQENKFTAAEWNAMSANDKEEVLMNYRIAYRKVGYVNWCEALGTVLANDQVKDGISERGGHPVEQKAMTQWYLRITAYAERMLNDLTKIDWSDSLKAIQKNWIGRSEGASIVFDIQNSAEKIEVFTTRPDTIFGATYMVLAPEHDLVAQLTTPDQKEKIDTYIKYVKSKSEIDRMAEKEVTGEFTGAYAINPFTNTQIPIWIGEYVLKDYGTGAIMAVPSDDERDHKFATKFGLEIIDVIDKSKYPNATMHDKLGIMINSGFMTGMEVPAAIQAACDKVEEMGIGEKHINYKLRDANFSRQRYWGEPFPIEYDADGKAHTVPVDRLPVVLPVTDDFKPGEGGKSALTRMTDWVNLENGRTRETDVMPAVAGSSWYFLRYMDPNNPDVFASQDAINYWQDVDLYIGGSEHAVAHLMYARFWHKFLYDKGLVPTNEPFKKLVNQGMIQGIIEFMYLIKDDSDVNHFICTSLAAERGITDVARIPVYVEFVTNYGSDSSYMNLEGIRKFIEWRPGYANAKFECGNGIFQNGEFTANKEGATDHVLRTQSEVGKMSKSKFNVINPDSVIEKYGTDCFRMFEMFLGPIEQSKPWDTQSIGGVSRFLRKFWGLFYNEAGEFIVTDEAPSKDEYKVLHTAIKRVEEDITRFSLNTCVSEFMKATNGLQDLKCHKKAILQDMVILLAPFAPHICEELWHKLGNEGTVVKATYPVLDESYLVEDSITYPVSVNGKKRALHDFPATYSKEEIEKEALTLAEIQKYTEGKTIRKVIVVPKRMVNIVVG